MTARVQLQSRRLLDLALKLVVPSALIPSEHRQAVPDLVEELMSELQPRNVFEVVAICEFAQSLIEVYTLTRIQDDLIEGRELKLLADMPEEIYSGIPLGVDEALGDIPEPPPCQVDDLMLATAFMDVIDQVLAIEKLINSRKAFVDQQIAKWRSPAEVAGSSRIAWRKIDVRRMQR